MFRRSDAGPPLPARPAPVSAEVLARFLLDPSGLILGAEQKHSSQIRSHGGASERLRARPAPRNHHFQCSSGRGAWEREHSRQEVFCPAPWASPHRQNKKPPKAPAVHRNSIPRLDLQFSPVHPQAVHSLPTWLRPVANRVPTTLPTTRPVENPPSTRGWVQPGVRLWMGVWTTGDGCGRTQDGQKLSTTRLS